MSNVSDIKKIIPWTSFLEKVIDDVGDKGYNFSHIPIMHIITIANKLDMSYDLYIKPKMCALERKLNAMVNRNKSLNNKFPRNWRNPLNKKFESYRV